MKKFELQIIKSELLAEFLEHAPGDLVVAYDSLKEAEISTGSFSFYTSVSSVFSSKIEGEEIELDNYVKHKRFGIEFLPDYTKKIDDLYEAYIFAGTHVLNKENIAKAHQLLSKHIVAKPLQVKIRVQNMFVTTKDGRIESVAAAPHLVENEMEKFYDDLIILLQKNLSIREVFFFAAMIHLVFIKIHPWNDGNGRSARLIEKWILAQKLGDKAWFVQSEKYYYDQHQTYYSNIRELGIEYNELDYSKALPFLLMLLHSV